MGKDNSIWWLLGLGLVVLFSRKKEDPQTGEKASKGAVSAFIKPVIASITSKFGYRTDPITGKPGSFHNGIDLALPVGTNIKAPAKGIVIDINSGGPGGNQIILLHDNGYKTGYAHLSKQYKKKGDPVNQGDVIGLSGNTGNSTGPHLHFTLTDPAGNKIDPQKFIYT